MTTTQRGILPWIFVTVRVNVSAQGAEAFDTATVHNIMATIDYAYTPAGDDSPAEAAIRSISLVQPTCLFGDCSTVHLDPGFDLLAILPEIEVERLAELIVARQQNMAQNIGKVA